MNKSLWSATSNSSLVKSLEKDIDVDILIIGGGITGVSIGYNLIGSNKKVCLVEANRIGSGVTAKTTGKITYLQGHYRDIYKKYGTYVTKKYYTSQLEAIKMLKKIVADNKIDCDLEKSKSYLYSKDDNNKRLLEEELEALKKIGANNVKRVENLPDGKSFNYIIEGNNTYVFHPLKYLNSLKKILIKNKIAVYEKSRVLEIRQKDNYYLCKTDKALIKAEKVVVASHYPYFLKPFFMPLKVTLEKSYIGAFLDKYYDYDALSVDKECNSIRFYRNKDKEYKIYLNGSENIALEGNIINKYKNLKEKIGNYQYIWSNIDIMTGDYLPFIGKIKENLFLATGYNTWGMTNGTLAGKIIKDLLVGNSNIYEMIFDPKRVVYSKWLEAIGSSIYSFTKEKIWSNKSWYQGRVSFSKYRGKDIAIYLDNVGNKHIVYNKCPHLKCNLVFNEEELTWDCPCHGSRFDLDGYCIEGPSNLDISCKIEPK